MEKFVSLAGTAAVSLLIAVLSGLGVGSGGLFVIYLTELAAASATQARGMNLLFFVFSASAALMLHLKRRKLLPGVILPAALFSLLGTLLGVWVGGMLDAFWLRRVFGAMLVFAGAYSFFKKTKKSKKISKTPLQIEKIVL